jgi:hypothetical protein
VVFNDSAQSFTNASHVSVPHVLTISYFLIFLILQKERRERYLARQQVEMVDSV